MAKIKHRKKDIKNGRLGTWCSSVYRLTVRGFLSTHIEADKLDYVCNDLESFINRYYGGAVAIVIENGIMRFKRIYQCTKSL